MKKTTLSIFLAVTLPVLPALGQNGAGSLSLSLEQCRSMALDRNSSAVNSSLDVLAAEYQKREAMAEYFPRISFTALGFHALNPLLEIGVRDVFGNNDFSNNLQSVIDSYASMYGIDPYYSTLQNGYLMGVSLMQPVYAGGRIAAGNKLASIGVEAARLSRELQSRKTADEVEDYYWQTVMLQEKLATIAGVKELLDTLHKDVSSAFASGLVTRSELMQVELKRNELRSNEARLRSGIKLSKMNLFNAIGQDYAVIEAAATEGKPYIDSIRLDDTEWVPESPDNYYVNEESIAASMEETRLLDLNVEAKKLEKRMELGNALPQLAVGLSYGYGDFMDRGRFNGMAFATLQIPLSDWGKTSLKMKRMQTYVDKAVNERDYLNAQITLQVRKYWIDLGQAWDEYLIAEEGRESAEYGFSVTKDHYNAGMVTLAELLQAQTALLQAENSAHDALSNYRKALGQWQKISRNDNL